MSVLDPDLLFQPADVPNPTVLDIFIHEDIYDAEGYPYTFVSQEDYLPGGPEMELGPYPLEDVTKRREHGATINLTERRNAQTYFGDAMQLLRAIRCGYLVMHGRENDPITNADAMRVAHMGIELPRYLVWQKHAQYRNGEIPPETTVLSRALRGFHGVMTGHSWGEEEPSRAHRTEFLQRPYSAQEMEEVVLGHSTLEHELACAGHWHMISSMLELIEVSPVAVPPATAEVPFDFLGLEDFSKAMRSCWDIVLPGLQGAFRTIKDLEKLGIAADQNMMQRIEPQLKYVYTTADFSNLLVNRVIGNADPEPLAPSDLFDAYKAYTVQIEKRRSQLMAQLGLSQVYPVER